MEGLPAGTAWADLHIFEKGMDLRTEVKVMQKCIFSIADINKGSIQPGHDLLDPAQIDITNSKFVVGFFLV